MSLLLRVKALAEAVGTDIKALRQDLANPDVSASMVGYSDSNVADKLDEIRAPLAEYLGASDIVPLYTDAEGRILIGIDPQSGSVYAAGIGEESVNRTLDQYGLAVYEGSGPIYPILTDRNLRVLLGVNVETGKLVGLSGASDTGNVVNDPKRLAEPIVPAEINHILFYGQSLSVGAAAGGVISQTQPYANITFSGGPRAWNGLTWDFSSFKPLVEDAVSPAPDGGGNRAETSCSGAANFASTLLAQNGVLPSDHIILASTAGRGGYRIDQLQKGAGWYQNFLRHVDGAHALNADHAVHAICWVQGENDVALTDYATYRARLEKLQIDMEADIKQRTKQTHPVYFLTYQLSAGTMKSPDIAAAHLDLVQKSSRFFLATPTYHFPYATDKVHLTAIGYKWMGAYFGRSYASLVAGDKPKWLNPVSATLRESVIRVRFDVPSMPLVLDSTGLADTTDSGFRITADGVDVPIVDVSVDQSEVVITLGSSPSGVVMVRYGLDYTGTGLAPENTGSGNLRDSAPETITIEGEVYPLWNICPTFSIPVTILGE